jgi:hypothetical protein
MRQPDPSYTTNQEEVQFDKDDPTNSDRIVTVLMQAEKKFDKQLDAYTSIGFDRQVSGMSHGTARALHAQCGIPVCNSVTGKTK